MSYKQWVLRNRKGRCSTDRLLCQDSVQGREFWWFGKSAARIFGLTGVAGWWTIHLNLIPKRRNIYDPTLFSDNIIIIIVVIIIIIIIIIITAKRKSPCSIA